eukprot:5491379-Pleurochrysis_carterae.AAC.3
MMRSRKGKNVRGGRGLVEKLAILLALCTKGTVLRAFLRDPALRNADGRCAWFERGAPGWSPRR